jgi:hypothetical protein
MTTKVHHLLLAIFFILYSLIYIKTPEFIAAPLHSLYGKGILVVLILILYQQTNIVIAVLAAIAAYQLVKRSFTTYAMNHYLPSEKVKIMDYAKFNDFTSQPTLEEEMVTKMAPIRHSADVPGLTEFKPVMDGLHDAAPIDYAGVN